MGKSKCAVKGVIAEGVILDHMRVCQLHKKHSAAWNDFASKSNFLVSLEKHNLLLQQLKCQYLLYPSYLHIVRDI